MTAIELNDDQLENVVGGAEFAKLALPFVPMIVEFFRKLFGGK